MVSRHDNLIQKQAAGTSQGLGHAVASGHTILGLAQFSAYNLVLKYCVINNGKKATQERKARKLQMCELQLYVPTSKRKLHLGRYARLLFAM